MDIIKPHSFQLNMSNFDGQSILKIYKNKTIIILGALKEGWPREWEAAGPPLREFYNHCLRSLRRPALVFVDFCTRTSSNWDSLTQALGGQPVITSRPSGSDLLAWPWPRVEPTICSVCLSVANPCAACIPSQRAAQWRAVLDLVSSLPPSSSVSRK